MSMEPEPKVGLHKYRQSFINSTLSDDVVYESGKQLSPSALLQGVKVA